MTFVDAIFYPTKILTPLVLPPTGLILLGIVALLLIKRWPRIARATLWFSSLTLLALSTPIVARGLLAALNAPSLDPNASKSAQAVMILGGGVMRATPEYGDTLSLHALARTRYGAKLAKERSLPILVTAGSVYGEGPAEAEVMAKVLSDDYGIAAKWVETRSRHTAENAHFSAEMLKADNVRKILLVTHDYHMRRALAHCEAAGLICYAAPVSTIGHVNDTWIQQLPNAGALQLSSLALHEVLGNIALRWR
jgi:uncharacterized SAM-binding protein YcdF (DUF218 family)